MFLITFLLTGFLAISLTIIGVASAPAANYFWSNWSDGKPKLTVKNGAEGKFDVTWSGDKGNFVIGKGWNPGSNRNVTYTSTFSPIYPGNAYLAIYGWTTSPLVEYYIIEAHGDHHPSDNPEAKILGNLTSNGGTYQIMTKKRVNKPSIIGTATFAQYWSIRYEQRPGGGTVNTGNHFKAWESVGLKMGKHNYMIVAVEGQDSSGRASVEVGVAPPPVEVVPTILPTVAPTVVPTGAGGSS